MAYILLLRTCNLDKYSIGWEHKGKMELVANINRAISETMHSRETFFEAQIPGDTEWSRDEFMRSLGLDDDDDDEDDDDDMENGRGGDDGGDDDPGDENMENGRGGDEGGDDDGDDPGDEDGRGGLNGGGGSSDKKKRRQPAQKPVNDSALHKKAKHDDADDVARALELERALKLELKKATAAMKALQKKKMEDQTAANNNTTEVVVAPRGNGAEANDEMASMLADFGKRDAEIRCKIIKVG